MGHSILKKKIKYGNRHRTVNLLGFTSTAINKKSQTWIMEFVMAFFLFSAAVVMSVKFISNISYDSTYDLMLKESEHLSNNLLAEGYPSNWTADTVIIPGLLTDGKISPAKLAQLYNVSYASSRKYFNIEHQYFIYFSYNGISNAFYQSDNSLPINSCGYGNSRVNQTYYNNTCHISLDQIKYDNLVKSQRLVVYNNTIIKMIIYIWQ